MPTNKVDHKWYEALQRIAMQLEGHSQVALYFNDDAGEDDYEGEGPTVDAERTLRHFLEMYGLRVPIDTSGHRVPGNKPGETFPALERSEARGNRAVEE